MAGVSEFQRQVVIAALEAVCRGWKVFPVHYRAKVPATDHGFKDATLSELYIFEWFEKGKNLSLGFQTGSESGFWVLDIDGKEGAESLGTLTAEHGSLPETPTAETGSGGWHLYFALDPETKIRNSAGRVAPGIDVRGDGGYVVGPPSIHPSGAPYRWQQGRSPEEIELAAAPGWLVEEATKKEEQKEAHPLGLTVTDTGEVGEAYVAAAIREECRQLATTQEGGRNHQLNSAAYALARFVADGKADRGAVIAALAQAAHEAGLGRREISKTIHSAFRARGAA